MSYKIENLEAPIIPGGHFSWNEATKGGERLPPNQEVYDAIVRIAKKAEWVREKLGGKPVTVTSWYRPPAVNRAVGGARYSRHINGDAMDIAVSGLTGKQMKALIDDEWEGGLGIYPNLPDIIHIDDRGYRARW